MKTRTSMSTIIDTRKIRKHRTMIPCNCAKCVNNQKEGCRFGWEPINGKCSRFGTNHYKLKKEEVEEARRKTAANKIAIEKERLAREEIHLTTIAKLESALDTNLSYEQILKATNKRIYGNGRFTFKCIEYTDDYLIIRVTFRDKKIRKYKILK